MRESLLIRHFLRRFLDNDLISPDADRRDLIAVAGAALVAPGLFVTVLLSFKYQFWFHPPGVTSLLSLDDRYLYFGCSMIVMALVAIATWDSLSLDARDAAILGTLPLPRRTILRAKIAAVVVFASAFAVALNLLPSVMYPALLPGKVLPVGVLGLITLIAAHAVISTLSGAFGFLAILTIREVLRMILGARWSRQISEIVRGALVVGLATVFLLLPVLSSGVARSRLTAAGVMPNAVPPLWFVGMHEMLAGDVIADLPRQNLRPRFQAADAEAARQYRGLLPLFRRLAATGVVSFAMVLALGAAAYVWNSRTPAGTRGERHPRAHGAAVRLARRLLLVRHPAAQAGFFFALQTLSRSAPHHLSVMTATAVGLAVAAVSLRGIDFRGLAPPAIPLALLAPQTILIVTSTIGFRQAIRIPAEWRATWHFVLCWSGDERPYLSGVKRAALVRLTLPILFVFLPVHVLMLGAPIALAHFACGLLVALLLLEWLLLDVRSLPLVSSYAPTENLWGWAAIYLLTFMASIYAIAWMERFAFSQARRTVVLLVVPLAALAALRGLDAWLRRRTRVPIDLEALPAPPTQRLSLGG